MSPGRSGGHTARPGALLYRSYTLQNINPKTDQTESVRADIYTLERFDKELAVGVRFEGEQNCHPYVNTRYVPATLGDFLSAIDYDNTIRYGNIRLYQDGTFPVNAQNRADIRKYLLSDGSVKNTNATARPRGAKVTLNINCDELGMTNKVMDVYESGCVYTNLVGYGYCFYVGKENAAAFLKNSYHITFAEIAQLGGGSEPTTKAPTASTADNPTTVSAPNVTVATTRWED